MAVRRELEQFPLTCTDADPPAPVGHLDARRLRTPPYAYGWIVPYENLKEAAEKTLGEMPPNLQGLLVNKRWRNFGYADKYGLGQRPELRPLVDERTDGILVYIRTNQTAERVKEAVADEEFREACRHTLGHPKGLDRPAMWFRVDMKTVPDGYEYEFSGSRIALFMSGV